MSADPALRPDIGLTPFDSALFGFPCAIASLHTTAAVGTELVRHIRPLGFDTYTIGALPPRDNPHPTPFTVDNLPAGFWDRYMSADMARHDPALRALAMTCAPVSFKQIREGKAGFAPSARELEVLDLVAELGAPEGLIVPVFRSQGYRGVVALTGPGPDPKRPIRSILQFLAEHVHDRMRQLIAPPVPADGPFLTDRESELMLLAQRGLNDEEIAVCAGITVRTVRFHFGNVRRKVRARSRAEAIATAINLNLLPR